MIAARRSDELAGAIRAAHAQGGRTYLLTLTMRHRSGQGLAELWDGLSTGWRRAFGGTPWTGDRGYRRKDGTLRPPRIGDRDRFGVGGLVRAVEVTHGGNGWHLHAHVLVVTVGGLGVGLVDDIEDQLSDMVAQRVTVDRDWLARQAMAAAVFERWAAGLTKAGLEMPGSAAVDLRPIGDDGDEYVSAYLAKSTYDVARRLGAEVAAGAITKTGRGRNRTPFELLGGLVTDPDAPGFGVRTPRHWHVLADGNEVLVVDTDTNEVTSTTPHGDWRLWVEFEQASKGRRQLVWSHRVDEAATARERFWNACLDARGGSADMTDEELADERLDGDAVVTITREAWYRVVTWNPAWMVELLELAESQPDRVRVWCEARGIAVDPPGDGP
ncbi:hypothetical protein P0W64_09320 [Tsukamurella sp. 8F]|uniref:hypothetical protein n=1 Tax=unclassified Tsukamurella TaxID=2633480 RepID=UPI0023B90D36|nr:MULTISPECIES: hypothetical protein [unclassified Tsukamurella]MDF0529779.1 hypothetical protein [Tsukamurella sp. 8J]MDF0586971.1 hypothetical protein [Tsukamurella sp. 8F]